MRLLLLEIISTSQGCCQKCCLQKMLPMETQYYIYTYIFSLPLVCLCPYSMTDSPSIPTFAMILSIQVAQQRQRRYTSLHAALHTIRSSYDLRRVSLEELLTSSTQSHRWRPIAWRQPLHFWLPGPYFCLRIADPFCQFPLPHPCQPHFPPHPILGPVHSLHHILQNHHRRACNQPTNQPKPPPSHFPSK